MIASNFVQLIGYLGNDPQLIATSKGKNFIKLNLATHEKYITDKGETMEKTSWPTVHVN